MKVTLEAILRFLGTNELVLGIASFCGIVGFALTIFVSVRTTKISKILKHNQLTSQYNKERLAFQNTFEGHRSSITEDNIKTEKLLKDILKNVEEYRNKFNGLLSFQDRLRLFWFSMLLKKEPMDVNWNSICNNLAIISGRLGKKEDQQYG